MAGHVESPPHGSDGSHRIPRPGEAFRNGKLYLFNQYGACVFRFWPDPRAWAMTAASGVWRGFTPRRPISKCRREISALSLRIRRESPEVSERPGSSGPREWKIEALKRHRAALEAALATLPAPVLTAVSRLPFDQWAALRAMHHAPEFIDLSRTNPALLLALLTPRTYGLGRNPPRPDALRRLALRRQREILGWLGLPAEESLARTFAKVSPRGLRRWTLRSLVAVARDAEARQRLSHLRRIQDTALWLLATPERRAVSSPRLLEEVALERSRERRLTFAMWLRETLRILAVLDQRPPARGYRSMEQVERAHERVRWEALVRGKLFDGQNDPFPRPPYPEEEWIEAIRTPGELIREAEEQHNCVAAYIEDAREGRSSFYRVLAPERATLELRHESWQGWVLHDIRTIDNGLASAATWRQVHQWLTREWPVEVVEGPESWDQVPWSEAAEEEIEEVPG